MASPVGGQFLVGAPAGFSAVTLGINDGTNPIFPVPASGNFNIEVFTAFGVTTLPTLDPGFQAGIIDPGGTLIAPGFLTGNTLRLFTGDYLVTDSVFGSGQTAATIVLGSGNQTVVGAPGDTLQGGSGTQVLNPIQQFSAAGETIIGGSGPTTVYGGPFDSVVAGSGNTYIDGTAGKMSIKIGTGGTDLIVGTSASNTVIGVQRRRQLHQSDRQRDGQRDGRGHLCDVRRRRCHDIRRGQRRDRPRLGRPIRRRRLRPNDHPARLGRNRHRLRHERFRWR